MANGDVLGQGLEWLESGRGAVLATVVSTWGSSPLPVGSHLCVRDDGAMVGSVSGGCVEGAVVNEALEILKGAETAVFDYGVTDEMAWEVGLACGGEIRVLVRRLDDLAALHEAARERLREGKPSAIVTRLADGVSALITEGEPEGPLEVPETVLEGAGKAVMEKQSRLVEDGAEPYFIEAVAAPRRLVLIGAVHIAQALAPLAKIAGFHVVVIDPRQAFATDERFPDVKVIAEWPEAALGGLALDNQTAVVTLTHDPKLDDPALKAALTSPAFYVGALGSKKTQAKRAERLAALGLGPAELEKIHGPVGLDIGAVLPGEIAVAIMAEIINEMCGD
ncbi:MAG: XdhC/CoxI family protein [Rhodospirillaceae bacterium]|nr:XdhC/CoxI family protein [Rhodospirillaceae bacterium]